MEMEAFIKHNFYKNRIVLLAVFLFSILAGFSFSQDKPAKDCECETEKTPKVTASSKTVAKPSAVKFTAPPKSVFIASAMSRPKGGSSEKSIAAHPKVYVFFCVASGNVKVNGWNRNEVRAFVDGGSKVDFKVRERIGEEETPTYIEVYGKNSRRAPRSTVRSSRSRGSGSSVGVTAASSCLSGDTIELDVPKGAKIKIKGSSKKTNIDSVRWAEVRYHGGSIYLSHVSNGIDAQTYSGNVTVKDSGGKMSIGTFDGDLVAYRTESNEIGDYLKAKTQGGSITLQSVGQRDVKANSVSGSINFVGKLANYGRYSFDTGYGTISLGISSKTSCTVDAKYGGWFKSELKLKEPVKTQIGNLKTLRGFFGDGSCNIAFKTFNGSILIREIDKKREIANNFRLLEDFRPQFRILP